MDVEYDEIPSIPFLLIGLYTSFFFHPNPCICIFMVGFCSFVWTVKEETASFKEGLRCVVLTKTIQYKEIHTSLEDLYCLFFPLQ
ncbi:hypothetical protein AAFF_G00106490 [Aldrovandia affinis]|uniref:Uncharacterized protein n=1 Tax=Aldrovandia affinis TaxID=143900 RepID=A0AAD7WXQ3_9TELE|nr:hypothetical protein AAFF_G00106490 [Aldrovandia affinis]